MSWYLVAQSISRSMSERSPVSTALSTRPHSSSICRSTGPKPSSPTNSPARGDEGGVAGLHGLEHPPPQLGHLPVHRAEALAVDELRGSGVVLGLDLQRRHLLAVGQPHPAAPGHGAADAPAGA